MKSIFEKRYISFDKAKQAALKAGIESDPIKDDKMWIIRLESKPSPRQELESWIRSFQEKIENAQDEEQIADLYRLLNDQEGLSEIVIAKLDEDIGIRAEEIEATQTVTGKPAKEPRAKPEPKEWIRESSILKPTKMVWFIADEMYAAAEAQGQPMPSRKEVQNECVRRGIASGTARTQFQHWFKCRNEMAQAERAKIVDGKITK